MRTFQNRFEKYDLVIADEMGYISFERWGEILQDPVMTAAMIDRLAHQAYIVNMNGNSSVFIERNEGML